MKSKVVVPGTWVRHIIHEQVSNVSHVKRKLFGISLVWSRGTQITFQLNYLNIY